EWPAGWPDIEDYVLIDFNLTLTEVVAQEEEKFTAVAPIGTHYQGFREGFAHHLAKHKYRKEAKNDHVK
ncbi:MAG TPA: hypothetical protein VG099_21515, partial [Gemmataceae bacterium]|nr:hypothetical protein [Gemmataceae bacterium]